MRIIQIVPHLPPPFEGVGTYAAALAGAFAERAGLESRFVVGDPAWSRESGSGTRAVLERTAADLLTSLEDEERVLLHYVNYGYESRGCPSWLIAGLRKWKARTQGRLVTIFHETYAMGPPWRSSFWLSPLQRRLAASLARLSEGLATSMQFYRRRLLRWVPGKEIPVLPVFSTVGEPLKAPPLVERGRRLVVFGGSGTRGRAYREVRPAIETACRELGIEEVCDIGPVDALPVPELSVYVRRLGPLPEAEVSKVLLDSVAGFVAYPGPFLAKSTVFAAYCAHRVLPVCAWAWPRRQIEPLPPLWMPQPGAATHWDDLQSIADRAHAWYVGHNLDHHRVSFTNLLFP